MPGRMDVIASPRCHCLPGYSYTQWLIIGSVSCSKMSGCWRVRGSKGITAGCVDLIYSLLPSKCGLTCRLEYQGYGVCDITDVGVVCYACHPGLASVTESDMTTTLCSMLILHLINYIIDNQCHVSI